MRSVAAWLVIGLVAGLIGRAIVPGRHRIGCLPTILLGIVGSFVGGTLGNLLFRERADLDAAELLGSIVGAALTLFAVERFPRARR
ncbi:MAG TPA: GlsB/YeaQ/YmgE family stress response membrane protein [Nitriliruptorales bacterium]